jgi:glycosyltransferase involved in cell wall biosynthesis
MPLVSVIMPSYNHAKYLPEAIESVLGQTFSDFELIIIDDGSIDGSPQIIEDYKKKDARIIFILHTKNQGISNTFNELIDIANGKFLAPIASDDIWVKDKLKKQVEKMEQDENLIIWTEGEIIDSKGVSTNKKFTHKYNVVKKNGYIFEELLGGNFVFGSSMMYKKENLDNIKPEKNLKYLNDHKFFLDLAYKYHFYFIPESLTKYRVHGKNSIVSDMGGWYKDFFLIGRYITHQYGDKLTSKEANKKLFHLIATTPLYRAWKEDPWNKLNLIYGVILPIYAISILFINYFQQKINND